VSPISQADKLKARRAAVARKEAAAKRTRPAAGKARRAHKRRTPSKTMWTFDT
jgi:hypothetical protein